MSDTPTIPDPLDPSSAPETPETPNVKNYTARGLNRRSRLLILAGIVAIAVIGFLVGIRAGVPAHRAGFEGARRTKTTKSASNDVIPAMSYSEVGKGALRNATSVRRKALTWEEQTKALKLPPSKPVVDMESRLHALATRAERRAFNGAPPSIPHHVQGLGDATCIACHGKQLQIDEGRIAKDLPHPFLTNCRQCHATMRPSEFQGMGGMLAESAWQGVTAPTEGPRAYAGAPPQVPHSLHMRSNCIACHGPAGWPGMQTTHPERKNCLQCHAPTQDGAHPGRLLDSPPFMAPPNVRSK